MSKAASHPESIQASWLVGGGEMGKVIRAKDWSLTPLGPLETWPPSLRTTVSLALNSNFPISLAWGPEHIQIYNDGYWPICGDKHPEAMGQDFTLCWASAFPAIGGAFHSALAGTTAFLQDQRMFLDRLGFLEETFFTFSFSPIRDETGAVAGLFHPVTETTGIMLAGRRARILLDVAALDIKALSLDEALAAAAGALGEAANDVPFALFYRAGDGTATLVARTGLPADPVACPALVDLSVPDPAWGMGRGAQGGSPALCPPGLHAGPYPEPVEAAMVHSIRLAGQERPVAYLVAGISTRLPLNDAYRAFFELLAAAVTSLAANATAFEEERRRADALAEIDRAKTVFFSNVSHEFRTPLTLLLGPLEDELADPASEMPPAGRDRLRIAHRNALRLLKLVNTLLDFARIEAGRLQAEFVPTDLAALTSDLAGNFRSACAQAGLAFTVDCPPLGRAVDVDRDMWEKIVLNLLSNAFKFTLEGGIAVELKEGEGWAELVVRDTGAGIPGEEVPRVFERFHRIRNTPGRTHEGAGIGLALTRELVALHGGTIQVESTPGRGSAFTVRIPSGAAAAPVSYRRPESQAARLYLEEASQWLPAETPAPAAPGRPRILLADDNADMRAYVLRLLADDYEVEAVPDGAAALAAVRREPPMVVLSDIMMPRLDGFGLLRELRADEALSTIPVILLSARAGEEERIRGLALGAADYLTKPFTARELRARVRAHVDLAELRLRAGLDRVDEVLRESEQRFRSLAEAMPQIVWTTDAAGKNDYFNRQWVDYTGMTMEESHGDGWNRPFHPEDRQRAWEAWQRATATGGTYALECRLRRADGVYRWWLIRGVPQFDASGTICRWFGTCTDIEAMKQQEKALRETQKMDSLGSLAGGVAHDMNNVLGAILALASVHGMAAPAGSALARDMATVASACQRGGSLVKGLLGFARQELAEERDVDLNAVIRQEVELLERTTLQKVRLVLDLEADLPAIVGDPSALHHCLMNLCVNAVDAMPEGGTLTLRTARVEGGVLMEVADTGAGMSQAVLDKALEPFFTTKPQGKGTGLGLAIVYGTVKTHQGTLEIQSEPGRGTRVLVRLPAAAAGPGAPPASGLAAAPPPSRPLRVLVVDDDELILLSVPLLLRALGHDVATAQGGEEALALLEGGERPDVIILDMNMPGADGGATLPRLRGLRPGVPVLLATGRADQTALDLVAAHSGVALLAKPFDIAELKRRLTEVG